MKKPRKLRFLGLLLVEKFNDYSSSGVIITVMQLPLETTSLTKAEIFSGVWA